MLSYISGSEQSVNKVNTDFFLFALNPIPGARNLKVRGLKEIHIFLFLL